MQTQSQELRTAQVESASLYSIADLVDHLLIYYLVVIVQVKEISSLAQTNCLFMLVKPKLFPKINPLEQPSTPGKV